MGPQIPTVGGLESPKMPLFRPRRTPLTHHRPPSPPITPFSRPIQQSKAFLSATPRLTQKLQEAIVAKLASGETPIGAEAGAIPSDPAFPITSSDTTDAEDTPLVPEVALGTEPEPENFGGGEASSENSGGKGSPASEGDGSSSPPPRGGGGEEEEGVLLEPGVASVADLFEIDVFTKEPVKKDGKGSGVAGDGAEGKEEVRA